ncbi:MAG: tetratricopeptide repeat protein [Phycisphaerae bacterium]|nr:tetratricopeptide repeat protein [Phycisphaerae bacterium]
MRFSTHGRALWLWPAALGILALGLTFWAASEGYTMQGKSKQPESLSVVAGRIEARISQSGKPGLEKVRLGVLLHADNIQTADALFKALKDGGQDDEYAVLGYAKAKFLSGQSADGFRHLQELCVRYPNSPTILYELGMAHIRQARGAEGIVLMKRVLEIDPFYARANHELARWSAARSQPDKAVEYARRVLCVEDPGSPLAEKALLLLDKLIPENKP